MMTVRFLVKVLALPLVAWLGSVETASAQAFGFGHIELYNGSRPGVYVPYEGAGYSHRYNYLDVNSFYVGPIGINADHAVRHFEMMVEVDRQVRAIEMAGELKSFDRMGPLLPPDRPPLTERVLSRFRRCP